MKYLKFLGKFIQRESTLTFIGGFILAQALKMLFGDLMTKYFGISLIFIVILALGTIYLVSTMKGDIETKSNTLTSTLTWVSGSKQTYVSPSEMVRKAKDRILIIGVYNPEEPAVKFPDERADLLKAIEEVVEKRLSEKGNHRFYYKRILQVTNPDYDTDLLADKTFNEQPAQTAEHYRRLSNLIKAHPDNRVYISLSALKPVGSLPSILIVDDKFIAVGLLTPTHYPEGPRVTLTVDGAFNIEDRTGHIVDELVAVFERVEGISKSLYKYGT